MWMRFIFRGSDTLNFTPVRYHSLTVTFKTQKKLITLSHNYKKWCWHSPATLRVTDNKPADWWPFNYHRKSKMSPRKRSEHLIQWLNWLWTNQQHQFKRLNWQKLPWAIQKLWPRRWQQRRLCQAKEWRIRQSWWPPLSGCFSAECRTLWPQTCRSCNHR